MKNILKSKSGFSLLELMTTLGIMSVIVLVIVNSQKSTTENMGKLDETTEVNFMMMRISGLLAQKDNCELNFKGKVFSNTYAELKKTTYKPSVSSIIISSNAFISKDPGPYINNITTRLSAEDSSNNTMLVIIDYQRRRSVFNATKNTAIEQFVIPIKIYKDTIDPTKIRSCHSDVDSSLIAAVKAACNEDDTLTAVPATDGIVSKYYMPSAGFPYGRCEHEVQLLSSGSTPSSPVLAGVINKYSCPLDEVLVKIDNTGNKFSFKCSKVTIAGGACGPWHYLRGVGADGIGDCQDLRTLFPATGYITLNGGVFKAVNLTCPTGHVLKGIDSSGNAVCLDPSFVYSCPANKYVTSVDPFTNTVTCSYDNVNPACGAGQHIQTVDAMGNVTCTYPTLPASCPNPQVMIGLDSSGNAICQSNPP